MTETKRKGLLAKLLVAQTAATAVEKKGRNQSQNYDYARAEDVIAEAQEALHGADLVGYMRPGGVDATEITSSSGNAGLFVTLLAELVIADPDSGEVFEIPARGTGVDYPGDKAYYKALTGASKYAYASVLGIPFGDDPENETQSTERKPSAGARSHGREASPAQKGAITKALRRHGITDEGIKQIVEAFSATTSAGASELLDAIYGGRDVDRTDEEIEMAVAELRATHVTASDVPIDDEGLPPADPEQPSLDDEPPMEDDPDSLEARAESPDG